MRARLARLTLVTLAALAAGSTALPSSALGNSFDVTCARVRVANDDPLVFPGAPGVAHRHEFFGSRGVGASTTTAQLRAATTSCAVGDDTAAYWVPTLEVRGHLLRGTMRAYYQRAGKASAAAPPQGLRMIAGDPHGTGVQPATVTTWQCVGRGRMRQFRTVPACTVGERLGAWVKFPDCWDGRRLDSPDHRAHVAYAVRGQCPSTHPVAMMRVAFLVTWPVRPASATAVTLADGMLDSHAMHGDFWNAWSPTRLAQLRWDCIEVAAPCGSLTR